MRVIVSCRVQHGLNTEKLVGTGDLRNEILVAALLVRLRRQCAVRHNIFADSHAELTATAHALSFADESDTCKAGCVL